MPPKSQKQARFFGAIAGGKIKRKGFSRAQARESLKGAKVSKLPKSKGSKKSSSKKSSGRRRRK